MRNLTFCLLLKKVVIISITAGVALLGVMSRFLRRRKPPRPPRRIRKYTGRRARNSMRSPNDMISLAGSKASARSVSPGGSTVAYSQSDRISMASGSVGAGALVTSSGQGQPVIMTTQLTAQQLGVMGMEALDTVINFWEDALAAHYSPGGVPAILTTSEESEFCREIQNLLDMAYTLQEQSELLFLDQRSVLFRDEPSIEEADEDNWRALEDVAEDDKLSHRSASINRTSSDPNFDSAESFASALDQVADLREFDSFADTDYEQYPLYLAALKHHEESPIPCRTIRCELVHCSNETEYLVKLHCIRLAFQYLFKVEYLTCSNRCNEIPQYIILGSSNWSMGD